MDSLSVPNLIDQFEEPANSRNNIEHGEKVDDSGPKHININDMSFTTYRKQEVVCIFDH